MSSRDATSAGASDREMKKVAGFCGFRTLMWPYASSTLLKWRIWFAEMSVLNSLSDGGVDALRSAARESEDMVFDVWDEMMIALLRLIKLVFSAISLPCGKLARAHMMLGLATTYKCRHN